eukprot:4374619-Pleurochrysis_carterae.AAC.1
MSRERIRRGLRSPSRDCRGYSPSSSCRAAQAAHTSNCAGHMIEGRTPQHVRDGMLLAYLRAECAEDAKMRVGKIAALEFKLSHC